MSNDTQITANFTVTRIGEPLQSRAIQEPTRIGLSISRKPRKSIGHELLRGLFHCLLFEVREHHGRTRFGERRCSGQAHAGRGSGESATLPPKSSELPMSRFRYCSSLTFSIHA